MNLQYITLGIILFIIATFGIIINRKNLIVLLLCIELVLLSINFILVISSSYLDNIVGELFAFYILVVAAAESAIGLSILVSFYRIKGTISVKFINLLRG
jgi:NADH-quinone oxidoreductase subunit K